MKNFLTLAASVALALAFACGGDSPQTVMYDVPVVGVAIEGKVPRMTVGDNVSLGALVMPERATNKGVAWSTSNDRVATVSGSGATATVTAVGGGSVVITARTADGGFTDTCPITIDDGIVHVASVALDKTAMGLVPGANGQLVATVLPANAANQTLSWKSSNEDTATFTPAGPDAVWVTAKAVGTATITATAEDGGVAGSCLVTVATHAPQLIGLSMNRPSLSLMTRGVGGAVRVMTQPANPAIVPAIEWTTDNPGVATVVGSGFDAMVKGVGAGLATITAASGNFRATCNVVVAEGMPFGVKPYATGYYHTLAFKTNGRLFGWGWNDYGHLGIGTIGGNSYSPIPAATAGPAGSLTWVHISASSTEYSAGIASDGSLWTWGNNANGRLGNGEVSGNVGTPVRIGTGNDWALVSCGFNHTMAIKTDGTLWGWGNSFNGRVGNNVSTQTNVLTPVQIGTARNWRSVCAANAHSVGLQSDGTLWTWGTAGSGRLGNGTTTPNVLVPTRVGTDSDWVYINAGSASDHTFAIKADGTLWAWGVGTTGRLGVGTANLTSPTKIGTGTDWHYVAAGTSHSAGLRAGCLYTWGGGGSGQLGTGSGDNVTTGPVKIGTGTYDYVAAGEINTAAITLNGDLFTAGHFYGLGTGATSASATFVPAGSDWALPKQ